MREIFLSFLFITAFDFAQSRADSNDVYQFSQVSRINETQPLGNGPDDMESLSLDKDGIVLEEYSGEGELFLSDSLTGETQRKSCHLGVNFDISGKFINYWYANLCDEISGLTFSLELDGNDLFLVDLSQQRLGLVGYKDGKKYSVTFEWFEYKDFEWGLEANIDQCESQIESVKLKRKLTYFFDLSVSGQMSYQSFLETDYLSKVKTDVCWQEGKKTQFIYKRQKRYSGTLYKKKARPVTPIDI